MAANTVLKGINWNEIAEMTPSSKKATGMVDVIRAAAKEIMADGKEVEIRKLQKMIEIAMNLGIENDEDKVVVNWVTVKYAITTAGGFREVSKNTFVMDPTVKKPAKKNARK